MAKKSAKNAKNSVVTNPVVIRSYSALAKSTSKQEREFVTSLASMLESGKTSIRIARASVKEAIKVSGQAPSFRASHVESAQVSAVLFTLKGSEALKNSEIFKLADRMRTAYGIEEAILGAKNWDGTIAELEAEVPTIAETRAENATEAGEASEAEAPAVKVESVESIFADTLKRIKALGDIRALKTSDLEQLAAVAETLKIIAKNSKAA